MRVGIIMLYHESNTFIRAPITLESFREDVLLTGQEIRERFRTSHHELGGFFAGLEQADIDAVPLLAARIVAGGVVTADAYETLLGMMLHELEDAGPLDGLLLAPHGASVSEAHPDMDGHWLSQVRRRVGPEIPMISTLDPHANLSPRMANTCDAMIAYRSNPHLDQRQRGLEAAGLMARTLRGEVRPVQAICRPPVAISIERQATSEAPCKPMYELADRILDRPGVLSNSVILGFPYADVEEMGSAFIVVTDNAAQLAQQCADELGDHLWEHREEFLPDLVSIEEAVDRAISLPGPVCLLDMGDNIGGGSPGDGTLIAHAIRRRGLHDQKAFVCLCDPEAQAAARSTGVGGSLTLRMGGKCDQMHGPPLEARVTVRHLHDGRFTETEVRHSGLSEYNMGPTAVVETEDGLIVMLTSIPIMPFSLCQLTCCDLDPSAFQIIVAKGVHAPVAAYAPVCRSTMRVDTPGITAADMTRLPFRNRRRPMFPFERDMKR